MDDQAAPHDTRAVELRADDAAVLVRGIDRRATVAQAFEDYYAELLSFLRRTTRDHEAAEDLCQEAFLRLAREVEAGRVPEQFRAWLYQVASNLAVSRARRARTVLGYLTRQGRAAVHEDESPSPEEGLLRRERRSELDAVLATLPIDARAAILLSGQGFTGLEIAGSIGRSHAATRSLLTRTRIALRLALEEGEPHA
jgi:RNA polymerase sigma-70 factor, ECF subfamily